MLFFRLAWQSEERLLRKSKDFVLVNFRLRKVSSVNLTSVVRPATAAAIAAMSVVAIPEALAQEPTTIQSGPVQAVTGSAQRITMTMGKGQLFKTSVPYTKISITDEKIVEVTPQSNREFVFTPKGIGSTNVLVFDEKNTLIATLDINVESTARETYNEVPGGVRIYNFPWRGPGPGAASVRSLANPAFYHCNLTNCQLAVTPNAGAGPAPPAPYGGPAPTGTPTPAPQAGAPTESENAH
jgi:hypothetical protein